MRAAILFHGKKDNLIAHTYSVYYGDEVSECILQYPEAVRIILTESEYKEVSDPRLTIKEINIWIRKRLHQSYVLEK